MDKRIEGFETELHVCSVVRNKARVERARNFFGITHVGDLTAVRDVGFGAKKGGELGGGTDAGVMSSHNPPKKYVQQQFVCIRVPSGSVLLKTGRIFYFF